MPVYDYACHKCDWVVEKFHKMAEEPKFYCPDCHDIPLIKLLNTGAVKRNDATWIKNINGIANDLEQAQSGKVPYIETREEARAKIKEMYSDPHPAVRQLRQEYLERY